MRKPPRRAFNFWVAPAALAAVLVLTVTLVLFMSKKGVEPTQTTPVAVPAAKNALTSQSARAPSPALAKQAPPSAPDNLASRENDIAAPVSSLKKSAGALAPLTLSKPEVAGSVPSAPSLARSELTSRGQASSVAVTPRFADVLAVAVQGAPGAYELAVTIKSPDTGCDHYADWWEVVSLDGKLLYRRVLDHSHVGEQPFLRVGGPVPIAPDTVAWIRAHMHPGGYGGSAFKGSVASGFQKAPLPSTFASDLARAAPLSSSCDF
ncbi:MAG: hypothetical protein ACYC9J_14605 [Sulfuricaulis sp.]